MFFLPLNKKVFNLQNQIIIQLSHDDDGDGAKMYGPNLIVQMMICLNNQCCVNVCLSSKNV